MLHYESTYKAIFAITHANRVVPLSSAHTQAVAYLIGETAAEKITADYQ